MAPVLQAQFSGSAAMHAIVVYPSLDGRRQAHSARPLSEPPARASLCWDKAAHGALPQRGVCTNMHETRVDGAPGIVAQGTSSKQGRLGQGATVAGTSLNLAFTGYQP